MESRDRNISFTVEVSRAGLADQLSQLSRLYRLGIGLSYSYIHTPLDCHRSAERSWARTLQTFLGRVIRLLIGKPPRVPKQSQIYSFLGFDRLSPQIFDSGFARHPRVDVDLAALFEQGPMESFEQIRAGIEQASPPTADTIYVFRWSRGLYGYGRHLTALLNRLDGERGNLRSLHLPENYRAARKRWPMSSPFADTRTKVLVHLRKGDRVSFGLGGKVVRVYGMQVRVFDTIEQMQLETGAGHDTSLPHDTQRAVKLIERLYEEWGRENLSVVVISDGYARARRNTLRAMLRGGIPFHLWDLKQLLRDRGTLNSEFSVFKETLGAHLIVGEADENLYRSIHAVVSADIIVKNSGGFAFVINRLFNTPDRYAHIIDLNG